MALPTAFDTSLGSNFTVASCPKFFNSFLSNDDFKSCYPMSFFLKNSQSYVITVRSGLEQVEEVLAKSCSVNFSSCNSLMMSLGNQLLLDSNCRADYSLENPLVTQAYSDFLNFGLIYNATCLTLKEAGQSANIQPSPTSLLTKSTSTNLSQTTSTSQDSSNPTFSPNYCYTDSLFDLSDSADAYLYLLPLGNRYPSVDGIVPSCSKCTQQIMAIFHSQSGNNNLSISSTYTSAASIIVANCGNSFVNSTSISAGSGQDSAASTTASKSSASRNTYHVSSIQFLTLLLPLMFFIYSSL